LRVKTKMAWIMIVDDDKDVRTLINNILSADGHRVIESDSGSDCLKKLEKGEIPDLILLDVMMPGMDGWDVSRKIKENENLTNIPICILTAKTSPMDTLMSLESGQADWHLNKPISIETLIETVDWMLDFKPGVENERKKELIQLVNELLGLQKDKQ
jgi:two-component system alkaline phosphatase synthesis response regulator PhoP